MKLKKLAGLWVFTSEQATISLDRIYCGIGGGGMRSADPALGFEVSIGGLAGADAAGGTDMAEPPPATAGGSGIPVL